MTSAQGYQRKPDRLRFGFYLHSAKSGGAEIALFNLIDSCQTFAGNVITPVLIHPPSKALSDSLGVYLDQPIEVREIRILSLRSRLEKIGALRIPSGLKGRLNNLFSLVYYVLFGMNVMRLAILFKRIGLDVLFVNIGPGYPGDETARAACIAGRLAGIQNIILGLHQFPQVLRVASIYSLLTYLPERILDWMVERSCSKIIAFSRTTMEDVQRVRGFNPSKMAFLHNGVKEPSPISKESADALRKSLGLADSDRIIALVAHIRRGFSKGHKILLQAAPEILRRIPEARFVFIGSGDEVELKSFEDLAFDLGIAEYVSFLGHRDDVDQLLQIVHLLVLPSPDYECLPLAILEGMAAGKPIIASRIGGIPEAVMDGETGYLVEPGDVSGLAKAVTKVLLNLQDYQSMSEASRQRYQNNFSEKRLFDQYLALLRQLADKRLHALTGISTRAA